MAGSLSQRVVQAIAETKGVDETELSPPLYEVIDPDALDSLFRAGTGSVCFDYMGYSVTVTHDGTIEIAPGARN